MSLATPTKTHWWNEIHDSAFDLYFDKNTPQQDKFKIFEEIVYPAFKIIATSLQTNQNWDDIGFTWSELTQEIITFAVDAIQKYPYNPKFGAARSSYVQLIMKRRIWGKGNEHKKILIDIYQLNKLYKMMIMKMLLQLLI